MISEHAGPLAALGGAAGGAALHVAELGSALARLGHDVRVYLHRAGPATPLATDAVLHHLRPFGRWLAGRWTHGWRPDAMHAHGWTGGLAALVARRAVPAAVVQTFHVLATVERRHQGDRRTGPSARMSLERSLLRDVDRVVALSRAELDELMALGADTRRLAVIPSGVDSAVFRPADRRTGVRDVRHRYRILSVGPLAEHQGFEELIRALPAVPGAELVIVGGPPRAGLGTDREAVRLRGLAKVHGVADRVRLVGGVDRADLPRWYHSADVLACTPWYEPSGRTALEGMACGVPVVATAAGALLDIVVDGSTGVHVPPRDPVALAGALRALLADPARQREYGTAGVVRARRVYSWEETARRMATLYADAIEAHRRTSGPGLAADG